MDSKKSNRNKITIYLNDDMVDVLKNNYVTTPVSKTIARALNIYIRLSHLVVVELISTEGMRYITLLHISNLENINTISMIVKKNPVLRLDYERLGGGEFDLHVLGIFKTKALALDYLDYIRQKRVAEGCLLYHSDEYENRKIMFKINGSEWGKFLKICNKKKLSYHKVINKLIKNFVKKYGNE